MKFVLMIGLAGALASLPSLAAQQKDDDRAGVAEAIRFERAKQAAADRQGRIEASLHRSGTADRAAAETKTKAKSTKAPAEKKTPPKSDQR